MRLLAVSPCGELLATAAAEGPALLWRAANLALLGEVPAPAAAAGHGGGGSQAAGGAVVQPVSGCAPLSEHTSAASMASSDCTALLWLRCKYGPGPLQK